MRRKLVATAEGAHPEVRKLVLPWTGAMREREGRRREGKEREERTGAGKREGDREK